MTFVDQSIAFSITLKPVASSRWRVTTAAALRNVIDLEYHDRCSIVARFLQKLARLEQVVFDDRLGAYIRRIRAATRVYRVAGPVVVRLSERPIKICHL